MVACVTVLATPTSYEVRAAAKPMMSFGLTVSALSVASVLAAALTTMSKVSLIVKVPSLAVTFTETVSAAVGVLEKVRVAASKLSHVGSAVSSAFVAV